MSKRRAKPKVYGTIRAEDGKEVRITHPMIAAFIEGQAREIAELRAKLEKAEAERPGHIILPGSVIQ